MRSTSKSIQNVREIHITGTSLNRLEEIGLNRERGWVQVNLVARVAMKEAM